MKSDAEHIDEFAAWIEGVMRARGYDIDSPRGGGKTKLAEDAGVHRAAITRLLQRQSMPDLETMRGLSRALGIPVRDVLIRSGKLTEQDLPQAPAPPETGAVPAGHTLSADQAATALGIPDHLRAAFVQITEQLRLGAPTGPAIPEAGAGAGADGQAGT
ncbi:MULTISPECIES: helix-turn-helix domain-containing protein [Streptomyces]|uniref:Helix-turn-helix transcriptional regulator n=1 Tax=Streptomyces griseiscabiei TaxID=2993540 RepID=A0ABU4KZ95_9ACTN|nr:MULTISPECIES: helix-turn-helix transcriptional regulator [Streptomyces]MBZ3908791.1 helix-turn-helix transcriptional regulator [Streptomyces griseiscabiei]MDX2908717.1 helix-turn-helix transcriptional regulator [Streptomyces griseiscabiei]